MRYLIVALILAGCSAIFPVDATPTPAVPSGPVAPSPMSLEQAQVGQPYTLGILTECGIMVTRINGEWWTFTEPRTGGVFDHPWDLGTVTLTDEDHAVYVSSGGSERDLTRGGEAPPACF